MRREFFQAAQTRLQKLDRQRLRFIKYHHRARDPMQLATARCPVSVKRFEELDIGGDNQPRIPILGRQS